MGAPALVDRLAGVLGEAATVTVEPDGALTVAAAGSVASVRVVGIEGPVQGPTRRQPGVGSGDHVTPWVGDQAFAAELVTAMESGFIASHEPQLVLAGAS